MKAVNLYPLHISFNSFIFFYFFLFFFLYFILFILFLFFFFFFFLLSFYGFLFSFSVSFVFTASLLAYFPHLNSLYTTVKSKFDRMCVDYDGKLAALREQTHGNAKLFSLEIKKLNTKFPWIFFRCQKMSAQSVREVLTSGVELKVIDQILTQFEKDQSKNENSKAENSNTNNLHPT